MRKTSYKHSRPGLPVAVAPQFRDSKSYGSIRVDGPVSADVAVTDPAHALKQGAGPLPAALWEEKQAMADSATISP